MVTQLIILPHHRPLLPNLQWALQDSHPDNTVERCHRYRAALGMLGGTSLRLGSAVKTPSSEVTVFGFSAYLSLDLSMSLTKDWP